MNRREFFFALAGVLLGIAFTWASVLPVSDSSQSGSSAVVVMLTPTPQEVALAFIDACNDVTFGVPNSPRGWWSEARRQMYVKMYWDILSYQQGSKGSQYSLTGYNCKLMRDRLDS